MDAKEVDLHHLQAAAVDTDDGWDSTDECYQLASRCDAHAHMPVPPETWRLQGPVQELGAVRKSEHVVIVLHIVQAQKLVDLFELCFVVDIAIDPSEVVWQVDGLLADVVNRLRLIDGAIPLCFILLSKLRHGLRAPEGIALLGPARGGSAAVFH